MTEHISTLRLLRRSQTDRMLSGVCGGLGRYFDVNPVFYRVAFVVLTLIGGAGILIYGACVLVIPNDNEVESIASDALRNHRQRPVALVGLGLVAIAGIALLSHISFHVHSVGFWIAVLVGGALILGSQRRRDRAVVVATPVATSPPEAPTVVETAPRRRRRNPIVMSFAVLGLIGASIFVTICGFGISYLHLGDGTGSRNYAPRSVAQLHEYRLGVGRLNIDLSKLTLTRSTDVKAQLGIGAVQITVPKNVTVRVVAHATWGHVEALGNVANGHNVDTDVGSATPELTIEAGVKAGRIEVNRS